MSVKLCDVCDYALDLWGRCAKCAAVLPDDIERMKHVKINWIICSIHGAHEVSREQQYRHDWDEPDPKDRRKKLVHHEWRYRCPKCDFMQRSEVECFKDEIELPEKSYAEEISRKMLDWESRKMKRISPHSPRQGQ